MASFEKGKPKYGGRQKGTPNKSTSKAKLFITAILEGEEDRIREALAEVYEKDKSQYLDWVGRNLEYVIPKLARTELEAEITDAFEKKLTENFTDEELIEFARKRAAKRS
jgi:hypothetical protein